jgi:hypothetical protein
MGGVTDEMVKFLAERYAEEWGAARDRELVAGLHESRETRDADAKRNRLALMGDAHAEMDKLLADKHAGVADQAMAIGRARGATVAVKYDVAIYSDHPDFKPEWALPDEAGTTPEGTAAPG